MKSLGSQIKEARLQRHMSQSALARQVGCKQSALSMFESGRTTALNAQTIGKLCAALDLIPPTPSEVAAGLNSPERQEARMRSYCPNPECPSNLPIEVGSRRLFLPRAHLAHPEACHCPWCGEILERACPECGAPVNEGAFCTHCGTPYLAQTPQRLDPERIAATERLFSWSTL